MQEPVPPAGHVQEAEDKAQQRRMQVGEKADQLKKFALVERDRNEKSATWWRTVDVLLVLASGVLAGIGGVLGIAKATVGASPGPSAVAQHASSIDPVVAGLIAVSATAVTTLATALGASKLSGDHRVASAEYLRLSNSADDLLTDINEMDAKHLESAFTKLRSDRDKVTEHTGKLPRAGK